MVGIFGNLAQLVCDSFGKKGEPIYFMKSQHFPLRHPGLFGRLLRMVTFWSRCWKSLLVGHALVNLSNILCHHTIAQVILLASMTQFQFGVATGMCYDISAPFYIGMGYLMLYIVYGYCQYLECWNNNWIVSTLSACMILSCESCINSKPPPKNKYILFNCIPLFDTDSFLEIKRSNMAFQHCHCYPGMTPLPSKRWMALLSQLPVPFCQRQK